jgi:hypothetical protein
VPLGTNWADSRDGPFGQLHDMPRHLPAWLLLALPLGIVVPIVAGFLLGGPQAGLALGLVLAAATAYAAIDHAPAGDTRWRRAAALRFLVPLVIALVGTAIVLSTDGNAEVIGWGVIGVAVAVALSLVFLEVGYSEDRDRER